MNICPETSKKIAEERTLPNSVDEAVIILISEYVLCEKKIYLNWSIVDLQCVVNFRCTAK